MIKRLLLLLAICSSVLVFAPAVASAVDTEAESEACDALNQVNRGSCGGAEGTSGQRGLGALVGGVVGILSWTVGIAAIFMLINGGLQYVLSAGDSSKVATAKTIIMYSLIGLGIAAIAQVIVRIVLTESA